MRTTIEQPVILTGKDLPVIGSAPNQDAAYDPAVDGRVQIANRLAKMSEAGDSGTVLKMLGDIYRLMQIGAVQLTQSNNERSANQGTEADGCEISARINDTHLTVRVRHALTATATAEVRAYAQLAVARLEALKRRAVTFDGVAAQARSDYERWCEVEVARLARSPYNLMLTGERGTGKTHLARLIHRTSPRAAREFIEFNCAALPEHLAEAQLFGYRKGAYTGAVADTPGLFEAATGGSIFLDEVAELTPALQAKLLKAVEEGRIRRIGDTRERTVDVRLIAATARDLAAMVEAGTFRADLYDRLTTLRFETLPLRERRGEIPGLVQRFLTEAANDVMRATGHRPSYTIETGALELLCAGEWTGNIRALRNTVLELTSYINDDRPITSEEVRRQITKVGLRPAVNVVAAAELQSAPTRTVESSFAAADGDIVLPAEACILRSGETLDEWIDRWTLRAIEAAQKDAGKEGKWMRAGWRLGLSSSAVKQRHRLISQRLERRGKIADRTASQTVAAWLPYEVA